MWGSKTKELQKYGSDITLLAQMGKLEPVIGRKEEKDRLIETLMKRRNSHACLVGDAGVGKTAIVEALALEIARDSVPRKLKGKKIFSISMGGMVDGAMNHGEIEKRMKDVLDEVRGSEDVVILFMDDFDDFIRDDAICSILKIALAKHNFKCIGASRVNGYKRYIERDEALEEMFETIEVGEPSREESIHILKAKLHKYQLHHNVYYTQTALVSAVDFSKHYIRKAFLPRKAINLMDKAGARARMLGLTYATEVEIECVVSKFTGAPVFTKSDVTFVLRLEDCLRRHLIGQDEAVGAVCGSIKRSRVGMRNEIKPIGCFLFAGPTGVGKTKMAKLLAKEYFGSEAAMVRLDTYKFMEKDAVSRLVKQLVEEVRQRPHSLILIDEIEKAHEDVLNVVLRILNSGRMSDNEGKVVDFSDTVVIVISNAESYSYYKAEMLNGFDQVVVFKPLEKEHIHKILEITIEEFCARIFMINKVRVKISEKLKEWLLSVGYDKIYGAHKLKRAFASMVETKVADEILCGRVAPHDTVEMDVALTGDIEGRISRFEISRQGQASNSRREYFHTLTTAVSTVANGVRITKTMIGGVDSEIIIPRINKHRHENPLKKDYCGKFVLGVECEVALKIVKSFYG